MGSLLEVALLFVQVAGHVAADDTLGTIWCESDLSLPIAATVRIFRRDLCLNLGADRGRGDSCGWDSLQGCASRGGAPAIFDQGAKRSVALSIEFRPADRMTEADRLLAADAESSIAEHAGLNGFEFEQGRWSYRAGCVSRAAASSFPAIHAEQRCGRCRPVFSASIPRGGEGRVRIIPILTAAAIRSFRPRPSMHSQFRRSTIFAPKSRRASHPAGMGNGLCYAALAGTHPRFLLPMRNLRYTSRCRPCRPFCGFRRKAAR